MLEKLAEIERRYEELSQLMADPEIVMDHHRVTELAQEQAEIAQVVQAYRRYRAAEQELAGARELLEVEEDPEMVELIRDEVSQLQAHLDTLSDEMTQLLLPTDPLDKKNVIVEVRAGAGGDEAGLFAADLYRMYSRYAEDRGWTVNLLDAHESGIGGFKEIVFEIEGRGAYSRLKFESGVHRVQRVPTTESSGRIHTSTATVAVLPEVEEVELDIKPDDIREEFFHSSGPGGQNVNKVTTAVRLIHLSTGIVVTSQDERSQIKNRQKAMTHLRAKLYAMEEEKQHRERSDARRAQVGTGDRSEKIRTYNFPQDRVTDHRVGYTRHNLPGVLNGSLDDIIDQVATYDQAERLQEAMGTSA
ncbi:MAG: peptide chain release factor 1 [Chloroflexi bacterium]|nr:peptide chain release factor 1 [Chloroflexota bacterium]MBU1747138.1 peptide chain release factor 1 [Chloroflexota bacterium]MBU1877874.1 peptide chain release factor 1 [Chloroflexota bacterium]